MENSIGHQICSELVNDIISQFELKRKNISDLSNLNFVNMVVIVVQWDKPQKPLNPQSSKDYGG